jgi:tripartite-type tricarboxylate transporter receptor subunit TctC
VTVWLGLFAPRGTAASIIAKLHHETLRAIALPGVRGRLEEFGIEVIGSSPAEFTSTISSESRFWAKLMREFDITLSN